MVFLPFLLAKAGGVVGGEEPSRLLSYASHLRITHCSLPQIASSGPIGLMLFVVSLCSFLNSFTTSSLDHLTPLNIYSITLSQTFFNFSWAPLLLSHLNNVTTLPVLYCLVSSSSSPPPLDTYSLIHRLLFKLYFFPFLSFNQSIKSNTFFPLSV